MLKKFKKDARTKKLEEFNKLRSREVNVKFKLSEIQKKIKALEDELNVEDIHVMKAPSEEIDIFEWYNMLEKQSGYICCDTVAQKIYDLADEIIAEIDKAYASYQAIYNLLVCTIAATLVGFVPEERNISTVYHLVDFEDEEHYRNETDLSIFFGLFAEINGPYDSSYFSVMNLAYYHYDLYNKINCEMSGNRLYSVILKSMLVKKYGFGLTIREEKYNPDKVKVFDEAAVSRLTQIEEPKIERIEILKNDEEDYPEKERQFVSQDNDLDEFKKLLNTDKNEKVNDRDDFIKWFDEIKQVKEESKIQLEKDITAVDDIFGKGHSDEPTFMDNEAFLVNEGDNEVYGESEIIPEVEMFFVDDEENPNNFDDDDIGNFSEQAEELLEHYPEFIARFTHSGNEESADNFDEATIDVSELVKKNDTQKKKIKTSNKKKKLSKKKSSKKSVKNTSGSKIVQLSMDGERIAEYSSTKEAAEALNIRRDSINKVIRGVQKSTGGYKWIKEINK